MKTNINPKKKFFKETVFYSHFRQSFSIFLMLFMAALLALNLFFAIRSNRLGIAKRHFCYNRRGFFCHILLCIPCRKLCIPSKKYSPDDTYTISVTENKFTYNAPKNAEIEVSFAKIKKTATSKHYLLLISQNDDIYVSKKTALKKALTKIFLNSQIQKPQIVKLMESAEWSYFSALFILKRIVYITLALLLFSDFVMYALHITSSLVITANIFFRSLFG